MAGHGVLFIFEFVLGSLQTASDKAVRVSASRCFFDVCDGIFLNYTWDEDCLDRSIVSAGSRCHDVYVGVDVFGRNCYGGGGFNSDKALSLIRSKNLSAALFAASWTHEALRHDNFLHLEYLFWQKLWPYLYIHGPFKLPFSTTFCQGYGTGAYRNGELSGRTPWFDLSKQNYQPSVCSSLNDSRVAGCRVVPPARPGDTPPKITDESSEATCAKIARIQPEEPSLDSQGYLAHYFDDAFNGGGCLQIGGPGSYSLKRMIICSFACSGNVLISLAAKTLTPNQPSHEAPEDYLYLTLLVKNRRSHSKEVLLSPVITNTQKLSNECGTTVHRCLKPLEISELRSSLQEGAALDQLNTLGRNGWKVRHYNLQMDGSILEIGAEVDSRHQTVLLGWLAVSLQ